MRNKNFVNVLIFILAIFSQYSGASCQMTTQAIMNLYNRFIKPLDTYEYKNRYVPFPKEKNVYTWRWEGKDFPRVIAVLEFAKFVNENKLSSQKALSINGLDPEWEHLPTNQIMKISYDANPKLYDLHTLDLPEKDFDFVMVNQTLEHVYDPIRCLENIYKHMRVGGILYLNVPANNILHDLPYHYYLGFTPIGLGTIVKAAGFEILNIGQWGNLSYLKLLNERFQWFDYRAFSDGRNQLDYPVIAWIFARKEK